MKFPLGAMSVGDILDRGLKLLFARLPAFFLINLIVLLPLLLFQYAIPFAAEAAGSREGAVIVTALFALAAFGLTILLQPIGTGAILHMITEEFAGRRVGVGPAFGYALGRFLPLLGTSMLVGLIVGLGFLLCIPGIYFAVVYAFIAQVVVLERLSGGDAMTRSKELVAGSWWRVFGVILLIAFASNIINLLVQFGVTAALPTQEVVPAADGLRTEFNPVNHVVVVTATFFVQILFGTYQAVCTTLLYLDTRIRKEGYDLELAAQLGEEARPPARRAGRYDDEYEDDYDDRPRRRRREVDEADDLDDPADRGRRRQDDDDYDDRDRPRRGDDRR